ncbi:hypothetical protein EGR_04116 [Echinococcus granulosus]|uniref:Uncharacterized protein n=1 Tax=Echinococcus granulosus TaxID=6210 RepID=W6UJ71_ECHGR|nr:hypothetical protein EGR_04116 [Echinococcus granulosus]EUB61083.1 hypothetical protein EGR_04116 [Echinococcus granulosus]
MQPLIALWPPQQHNHKPHATGGDGASTLARSRTTPRAHATPHATTQHSPQPPPIACSDSLQADARTDVTTGKPVVAICVQDVDVQSSLRFTLTHTVGCTLHRRTSRVIHRTQLPAHTAYKERQSSRLTAAVVLAHRAFATAAVHPRTHTPSGRTNTQGAAVTTRNRATPQTHTRVECMEHHMLTLPPLQATIMSTEQPIRTAAATVA